MAHCTECGTFTSDSKKDANTGEFLCRKCGSDLNGQAEATEKEKKRGAKGKNKRKTSFVMPDDDDDDLADLDDILEKKSKSKEDAKSTKTTKSIASATTSTAPTAQKNTGKRKMFVTTTDSPLPYEIIGPLFFFGDTQDVTFQRLIEETRKKYDKKLGIKEIWESGYAHWAMSSDNYEIASIVATDALKLRGEKVGATAIIGMSFQFQHKGDQQFTIEMSGTAVVLQDPKPSDKKGKKSDK